MVTCTARNNKDAIPAGNRYVRDVGECTGKFRMLVWFRKKMNTINNNNSCEFGMEIFVLLMSN
jgi:hypothetical protein